jgi:hypothetical protein
MATKLTMLIHKIAIQLHLVAESCTICSSRYRRSVRKLLGTPSYVININFETQNIHYNYCALSSSNTPCKKHNHEIKVITYS